MRTISNLSFRIALVSLSFFFFGAQAQIFTKITTGPVPNEMNNSYFATWGDYDKDGDMDLFHSLFFAAINNPLGNNFLYQNNCNGNFTKISQIPGGLVNDGLTGPYSYWIDYDNDGDLDIYVGPGILYQNQGNGGFTKVIKTITALPAYTFGIGTPGWADYDNDGYLDVYMAKQEIWHNNQSGNWTQLNVPPFTSTQADEQGDCVAWADYDNDGWMDMFVCNAGLSNGQPAFQYLYHNNGNGTFTSITTNTAMTVNRSYGCAWADYDNDLDLDLFISRGFSPNDLLFTNNGDGTFTEVVTGPVVTTQNVSQAGGAWGDYDNDGDLDLYVPNFNQNTLYDNNGDGTFTKNTTEIVVNDTPVESYGVAWADYDNDGDLDLFVPTAFGDPNDKLYKNNVYENNLANSKWLKLHLQGVSSNRDAIGARVYVKAIIGGNPKWQMREVNANGTRGGECGGASGHVVHFGLGNATIIDSLKIVWPKSGTVQYFTNVNPNRFVEVVENINSLTDAASCTPDMPVQNPGFITGKVYHDVNANCVFDSGTDFPIANKEIKAEPGAYFAFTDNNGNYTLSLPAGSYSVSLNPQYDYVTLQPCQSNSVYAVNVASATTQSNKDFASIMSVPCGGTYSVGITHNGIQTGTCAPGLLLTNPCPGNCHQYNFNVVNSATAASAPNSILSVSFPAGFSITAINSTCTPVVPLTPLNTNTLNIQMNNPIPAFGSCLVTVTVCLTTNTLILAPLPWVTSASYNSPGSPTVNLIMNPQFNAFGPGGSALLWQTQYGNPITIPATCAPPNVRDYRVGIGNYPEAPVPTSNPANCIFGWGGPAQSGSGTSFVWYNGAVTPGVIAWRQIILVAPNTNYQFIGWGANTVRDCFARPIPTLQVLINGTPQGANVPLPQAIGCSVTINPFPNPPTFFWPQIPWQQISRTWCSGTANTATIDILSISTATSGNDFGIDNLSFMQVAGGTTNNIVQTTSCSCDPNDKMVDPLGCGPNGNIGKNESLTYRVRFQNKGTGPATNVVLNDIIDSDLDIGTLRILASSHNITNVSIIPNNKLIVRFDNINLPAEINDPVGSHGFIIFSISPKQGLPDGTVITDQTGIYFDNNEVVLTEVTKNTLYDSPYPDPNFDYKHNCSNTGFVYDFRYIGSTPDGASYSWTFDGGTPSTSTQQNPTGITFANGNGYKKVRLIVNRYGCSAENNDTIPVINGLSDNGNKVTVCHNGNLITISTNALSAHLAHGDCIGQCPPPQNMGGKMMNNQTSSLPWNGSLALFNVDVMPNPSSEQCSINIAGASDTKQVLRVIVNNSLGQLVAELYNGNAVGGDIGLKLDTKSLSSGIYFIQTYYDGQIVFKKLVVQH